MARKLLNAGDLRHRVDIQQRNETQNATTGGISWTWETIHSDVPAQKLPISAREFEAAAAVQGETSIRFVLRWIPGIIPKMRLLMDGIAYNINGVLEDQDSGRDYMTLSCSAGVNAG